MLVNQAIYDAKTKETKIVQIEVDEIIIQEPIPPQPLTEIDLLRQELITTQQALDFILMGKGKI